MESLPILITGFLEYQKGCGLRQTTVKRTGYLLFRFARWLENPDVREVSRDTILRYKEHLAANVSKITGKPLSEQSIGLEMSTLKGFFTFLIQQDKILINPLEGMRIKPRGPGHLRKVFTETDISLFLDSIPLKSPHQVRDRALFELVYSSGLRVGDAINLELERVNLEERVLFVRGKGGKDAFIPFSETARRFLVLYLSDARKKILKRMNRAVRKEAKPHVFIGKIGKLDYHRLADRFHEYLEACGLAGKGYTMHSIRHATGTHLLSHGASVRYVQELLRHEDLKTTQAYTRPTMENIKAIYRTYHPRENEFFKEIDAEYLAEVRELKERLLWGRRQSVQYKTKGHKKGFGLWPGSFPKQGKGV
jgi:integrase/recombinase XerD